MVGGRVAQRHDRLDALRDDRVELGGVLVVHGAPGGGRPRRRHAAEHLHAGAVARHHHARALRGAGQQVPDHHRLGAGGDGLGHVPARTDAAVGDHGHAVRRDRLRALEHRAELGDPDAGDDAGGADRPGPDAHLHRVRPGCRQLAGALGGGDVAGDHVDARAERLAHLADRADGVLGVAVGDVEHHHVRARVLERPCALDEVAPDADGGAHRQPAAGVLRRLGPLGSAAGCRGG